jgi:hypothetical protein
VNKLAVILLATATSFAGSVPRTFTGVITDSMCVANHAMMRVAPDAKCVTECAKGGKFKYVLFDGKNAWKLSDQESPARFASQRVRVTGVLFEKTGVLRVDRIEAER